MPTWVSASRSLHPREQANQLQRKLNVLECVESAELLDGLRQQTHVAAPPADSGAVVEALDGGAIDDHLSGGWPIEPGQDIERDGLADDRYQLAGLDPQAHALEPLR